MCMTCSLFIDMNKNNYDQLKKGTLIQKLLVIYTFFHVLFQGQTSPTTGKLFRLGGTNDNDPIRFGGSPLGAGPDSFSFKPLDLKSSLYTAEGKKVSCPLTRL